MQFRAPKVWASTFGQWSRWNRLWQILDLHLYLEQVLFLIGDCVWPSMNHLMQFLTLSFSCQAGLVCCFLTIFSLRPFGFIVFYSKGLLGNVKIFFFFHFCFHFFQYKVLKIGNKVKMKTFYNITLFRNLMKWTILLVTVQWLFKWPAT